MINGTVIIGRKIGEFLVALGDAIVDNINLAKEQGVRIAKTILNALATAVPELADAVGLFAINLLNGLADVIRNRGKGIRDAALNLGDAILDAVSFGMFDKMKAGGNFLLSPFKKMGGYATDAWKWAFDSNSPSKLFIKLAGEIPAGIVAGLNKDKTAVSSVTGLSERIVNAASKSFGAIPAFDAIGDINPVISPVLDLTNVQQGARNINGMFSESQIGASVSLNQARALSIATLGNNSTSTENSAPVVKEVKFEQIINSPTTLSNAEIYRQTRSQIQMAKEELFK
jgi:hypothetical protein